MAKEIAGALPYDIGVAVSEFMSKIRPTGFEVRLVEIHLHAGYDSEIKLEFVKPIAKQS